MAAASTAVAAGDVATATQYNNLRQDAVHASLSHVHDGSFGAALTFASPVATGTANSAGAAATYVRSDHVHSTTLGTAAGSAAGNVAFSAQNTWYTIASITGLTAGTWMVTAHAQFTIAVSNAELRISYDSTVNRTWPLYTGATDGSMSAIGTVAAGGSVVFEGRRTNTVAGTALAGSHLVAIRVG